MLRGTFLVVVSAGAVFALVTFLWVVIAKPSQRTNSAKVGAPWGAAYAVASR